MKITVCLIDDDRIFQFLTGKMLKEYQEKIEKVFHFYDGAPALEYLRENQHNADLFPEIIFLDISMPNLNGWDFLDEFKTLNPPKQTLIYMISSSVSPEDITRAEESSQIDKYLVKPLSRKKLKESLKEALELLN